MRVAASQKLLRDSGEAIFAARHQDASQGPLGKKIMKTRQRAFVGAQKGNALPRGPGTTPPMLSTPARRGHIWNNCRIFSTNSQTPLSTRPLYGGGSLGTPRPVFTPMCVQGLPMYLVKSLGTRGLVDTQCICPFRPTDSLGRRGRYIVYLRDPLSREGLYQIHGQSLNTHRGKHRSGGAQGLEIQISWTDILWTSRFRLTIHGASWGRQPREPGETSVCRGVKIAAGQFLPLSCRSITLTTRVFWGHFEGQFFVLKLRMFRG